MVEPPRPDDLAAYARPEVLASWLILVLFGSFAAFTIFLRLLNDRGPVGVGGPVGAAWLALTGAAAAGKAGAPSSRRSGCAAAPPRGCR